MITHFPGKRKAQKKPGKPGPFPTLSGRKNKKVRETGPFSAGRPLPEKRHGAAGFHRGMKVGQAPKSEKPEMLDVFASI